MKSGEDVREEKEFCVGGYSEGWAMEVDEILYARISKKKGRIEVLNGIIKK